MNERPRSHVLSKRKVTLSTKISLEEADALARRVAQAGVTRSSYLRQAALSGQVNPPVVLPTINEQQWLALGRLGANLNQVAARLNRGEVADDTVPVVLAETHRLLADVRSVLLGGEVSDGG